MKAVVICSTIGCGACNYCRAGYYAQCQNANPNGPDVFAILSAQLRGAGRVLAVDQIASRLEQARRRGAETVDFSAEDPVA